MGFGGLLALIGWADLLALFLYKETLLALLAGVIVLAVIWAAFRSQRRWWLVLLAMLGAFSVAGVLLGMALEVF